MKERRPKLTAAATASALRQMPLAPVDGFVLSRVDGLSTEAEIVVSTGLDATLVHASLEKLASLGLVDGFDAPVVLPPPSPMPDPAPAAAVVEDGADLDPSHRNRIGETFDKLNGLDHYALLGVARDSDKKAVKRAYYELASLFHPDRFFRRQLGTYKPKMEAIFARVTNAHDVLTDKMARAEYDAYLGDVEAVRHMEARLDDGLQAAHHVEPPIPSSPPSGNSAPPVPTTSSSPPRVVSSSPPAKNSTSQPPARTNSTSRMAAVDPEADARARRDTLARRLLGSRGSVPPGPIVNSSAPPSSPSGTFSRAPSATSNSGAPNAPLGTVAAQEVLRRHYDTRVGAARSAMVKKHVDAARESEARKDIIGAANSYRLAANFAPDDVDLAAELDRAAKAADKVLAETYRRQAQYEEKSERWPEASRSWTKLAGVATTEALVQERAGHALLKAYVATGSGNLHEAAAFVQKALAIEPRSAAFHATLAAIYLEARLYKNARREAEAAQQLAPEDDSIGQLVKRVIKAG